MNMGSMLRFMLVAAAMVGCGGGGAEQNTSSPSQESQSAGGDPDNCSLFTVSECDTNKLCAPIWGWPMNVSENCFGARRSVICAKNPRGCDDSIFYARDPSGALWQFPSSCTPPGWPVEFPDEDTMMAPYCSQL